MYLFFYLFTYLFALLNAYLNQYLCICLIYYNPLSEQILNQLKLLHNLIWSSKLNPFNWYESDLVIACETYLLLPQLFVYLDH